jgi:signal transduction histidine kinase
LTPQHPEPNPDLRAAQELGERVVRLLSHSLQRQRAERIAQEREATVERLFERALQIDKLALYGQSVAGVLHELSNPLTAILSYANYLTRPHRRECDCTADEERLLRIREAAESALEYTRSLVEYARPAGTRRETVDLEQILRKALVFSEHELTRAGIATTLTVEPLTAKALGIPGQLTQLFVNLFTNAAQAARPAGAELRVVCRNADDERFILVSVTDNGTGIHTSDIEQVFEPFFTTKSAGRGIGLGLSIVRDIVRRHGGRIQVESSGPVGTTFFVQLPTAPRQSVRPNALP